MPFISWFLARESIDRRSTLIFLLVLLSLGFVLLYAREFEVLPSSTEFAGANFIARASESNSTVLQGEFLPVGAVTTSGRGPQTTTLALSGNLPGQDPSPNDFTYTVLSQMGQRMMTFVLGEERWRRLSRAVRGDGFGEVYSNGQYRIFLQLRRP